MKKDRKKKEVKTERKKRSNMRLKYSNTKKREADIAMTRKVY